MKNNVDKYPNVDKLPVNALTVDSYCKQMNYTTANLYKKVKNKKNIEFEVVVFQGINFIIPK